jgi:hypothetical protein
MIKCCGCEQVDINRHHGFFVVVDKESVENKIQQGRLPEICEHDTPDVYEMLEELTNATITTNEKDIYYNCTVEDAQECLKLHAIRTAYPWSDVRYDYESYEDIIRDVIDQIHECDPFDTNDDTYIHDGRKHLYCSRSCLIKRFCACDKIKRDKTTATEGQYFMDMDMMHDRLKRIVWGELRSPIPPLGNVVPP